MSDRREFFRRAAALTASLAASQAASSCSQQRTPTMPTPRASALLAAFGLKCPIFCAGMGPTSTPELAIAA